MTSRERVKKALNFVEVDRVPFEGAMEGIVTDIGAPRITFGMGRTRGAFAVKGTRTDAWGCIWEAAEDGVIGEVKHPILADWSLLDNFQPPWDVLKEADLSMVERQCEKSDKFMINMFCDLQPFQRMQYLRGTENLFMDLAYGDIEVFRLRDMVHEFYLKKTELLANTGVDGIHAEDDWGTQLALLVSPALWRELFKPLYRDYCEIAHRKGKYLVFHSDGNITEIIPDLIEIGVDAINAQIDCMDVEKLAGRFHGKIAFWGGFDRQYLLPFGTVEEVRSEVRRIAGTFFKYKRTGIIAQCFVDKGSREENISAYYDEWLKL